MAEELGVPPTRIRYAISQRLIGIYVTPGRYDSRSRVIEWVLMRPLPW